VEIATKRSRKRGRQLPGVRLLLFARYREPRAAIVSVLALKSTFITTDDKRDVYHDAFHSGTKTWRLIPDAVAPEN
jgi:hypothetical protein